MHLYLHFVNGMGIVALPFKFCTILFGMSILLNISKFVGFVNKTDFYLNIGRVLLYWAHFISPCESMKLNTLNIPCLKNSDVKFC